MSVCPFCGVVTDFPHENQAGCLAALAAEIARLRNVLEHVQSTAVPKPEPLPPDLPDDDEDGSR
jgi:hypothetical protein